MKRAHQRRDHKVDNSLRVTPVMIVLSLLVGVIASSGCYYFIVHEPRLSIVEKKLNELTQKFQAEVLPIGAIVGVQSSQIPNLYLPCDGRVLKTSVYPELFKVLGTKYGSHPEGHFVLPDLRGRTLVGEGQGPGLSDRKLGETGGAESHTLKMAELPLHDHEFSTISGTNCTAHLGKDLGLGCTPQSQKSTVLGGGQPHNIMQPFAVTAWYIKAK